MNQSKGGGLQGDPETSTFYDAEFYNFHLEITWAKRKVTVHREDEIQEGYMGTKN